MSRIKRLMRRVCLMALAVCLLVTGAWAQEDLLSGDAITPQEVKYKTEEVRMGSFVKESSAGASEYYPLTYTVSYEHANAKFVEYTVTRGDEVKAGDVLAVFRIEASEAVLEQMEVDYQRLQEETERGIESRREQIVLARAAVSQAQDSYDRELKSLELRRQELELERYEYRQNYTLEQKRQALEEEKAIRADNLLISPVDGVITDLTYKKPDDAVFSGETLVGLYSTDVMLMLIDNSSGNFRYNMPVTVSVGSNKDRIGLPGRVVAASDLIESPSSTYAFIELEPYDTSIRLRNPKATGQTVLVENVLMAPRRTITLENGKHYVIKLTDGVVQKRYISMGLNNPTDVWIIQGVSAGETLIVD